MVVTVFRNQCRRLYLTAAEKKTVNPANHSRNIQKKRLHSGAGRMPAINCNHDLESYCKAKKLTPEDLNHNFERLYDSRTKVQQDQDILSLLDIANSKRRRVNEDARSCDRSLAITYYLLSACDNSKIPVCKASFLSVLGECDFKFY